MWAHEVVVDLSAWAELGIFVLAAITVVLAAIRTFSGYRIRLEERSRPAELEELEQ